MAEKITPRSQDFSEWYHDVVVQARLADYSPVKGCMVIRPNGYSIWENIQKYFNQRIETLGVDNAYFPLFIPESFLKKEAEHVEGFAPQCAVVTYAGAKDLEEKLVVRPTSETIINSMFAKWIQSYRDLPLLINQWANVVRWEMRTRLFLRTTEFLWQEGHTCHATLDEAEQFTRTILKLYQKFCEEVLAMPVLAGRKSDSEKFAGALRTYSIEAMMQDKKALQAGTSHNLTDNFAKAFETKFLDKDSTQKHVHQTSWGVSTRLIGGMVMVHSDDKGLVLPPMVAKNHVAIVPIFGKDGSAKEKILAVCEDLKEKLRALSVDTRMPYVVRTKIDTDETKMPGWKFHEYELIGIPIRVEIGPRDLEKGQLVYVRRDNGEKKMIPLAEAPTKILEELKSLQKDLLERARKHRDENTFEVGTLDEFKIKIDNPGGFFKSGWCGNRACEEKLKNETKSTIRCLILDDQFEIVKTKVACMICGKAGPSQLAIYARSY